MGCNRTFQDQISNSSSFLMTQTQSLDLKKKKKKKRIYIWLRGDHVPNMRLIRLSSVPGLSRFMHRLQPRVPLQFKGRGLLKLRLYLNSADGFE